MVCETVVRIMRILASSKVDCRYACFNHSLMIVDAALAFTVVSEMLVASSCRQLTNGNRILDILRSLAFDDMDSRYSHFKVDEYRPAEDTCTWLLEHPEYQNWTSSQSRGVLWIQGKPGSGKSTLMHFLVEHLKAKAELDQSVVCSFFIHGRGSKLQKTPIGLYRSLLHQILGEPDLQPPQRLVTAFNKKMKSMGSTPNRNWR